MVASPRAGEGGEMKHRGRPADRARQGLTVAHITDDDLGRISNISRQAIRIAGEDSQRGRARDELSREIVADESGPSGDEREAGHDPPPVRGVADTTGVK